ncbi:MAG: hypothetical protein ACTSPA_15540 [Promethearchaeota archaeon]
MIEEADSLKLGGLVSYLCVSGDDPDNFYGILCNPSGKMTFTDKETGSYISQPITFVSLFPLTYGAIPVLCEARNIVHSIISIIGKDEITERFINSVNAIESTKYQ